MCSSLRSGGIEQARYHADLEWIFQRFVRSRSDRSGSSYLLEGVDVTGARLPARGLETRQFGEVPGDEVRRRLEASGGRPLRVGDLELVRGVVLRLAHFA